VFMNKRADANCRNKQHAAPMTENMQAVLSESARQLLHDV
jgi:hypothetical protein